MFKLSDDYDGFGTFSWQIYVITMILCCGAIAPIIFGLLWWSSPNLYMVVIGVWLMAVSVWFFAWGNAKQTRELKKRGYKFTKEWKKEHPDDT